MRNPSSSSSAAAAAAEGNSNNKKKIKKGTSGTGANSTSGTIPCCSKVGLKRGPWTPEEDRVLADYIKREGEGRWRTLPKRAGLLRCGKSCRLRWMNYLRPCVKRGHIAPDEEDLILRLHRLLGNRWSLIAGRIPGRTDNEIKNYWNTHLSKKLISQGIDPRTHKPLNPPKPIDIASSSTTTTTTPPSNNSSKPNTTATTKNNNRQLKRPNHPLPPIINQRKNTPSTPQYHRINDHPLPNPDDHLIIVNQDEGIASDDHHLQLDQYQESQAAGNNNVIGTNNIGYDHAAYDNLNLAAAATDNYSDVSAMDLIRNNNLLTTDNVEDDDDINYCSDDVFSSFLNSLINEDAFAAQNHLQQQPAADGHNNDNIQPPSDA